MSTLLEALVILALIGLNGVLALAEIAVVSARKARLQHRAAEGDRRARAALELAENPTQFLATVQLGITLVGILAGAFGGATVAGTLAAQVRRVPGLAPYADVLGLAIVVAVITYLSLVLGELVPKRLALAHPETIASAAAGPMRALARLASPPVWLLSRSTDAVLRLIGVRPSTEPPVTDEEIALLIAQGREAGVFEPAEEQLVRSVFRVADQRVAGIMTPRREVVWLDVESAPEEIEAAVLAGSRSRLPVARGSVDQVVGVVDVREVLSHRLKTGAVDLMAVLKEPLFVPESMPALRLLERFKQTGARLAIVVDEYGGTQGLVTLTDVLEAIVGVVPTAGEAVEPTVVVREDGSWLVDGMIPVEELEEVLGVRIELDEHDFNTLGGFVLARLGRIPSTGEQFDYEGFRFEVVDLDGNRVDKVLIRRAVSSG